MNTVLTTLLSLSLALLAAGPAFADGREAIPASPPPAATPPQVAPGEMPPPPMADTPAPRMAEDEHLAEPPQQPVSTPGQWVYTTQYGWIWMPHSSSYTYVPAYGTPYTYVYYPAFGWRWVASPWVFGWGPRPFWGAWGVRSFAWYSRPWFHVHEYRPYPRYGAAPRYSFVGRPAWAPGHGGWHAGGPHVRVWHGHR